MQLRTIGMIVCALVVASGTRQAVAEDEPMAAADTVGQQGSVPKTSDSGIAVYQSRHFVLTTDVPPATAAAQLAHLEHVLTIISRYWRQPLPGRIECYLAHDLNAWPDSALPHPLARLWIGRIGGATIYESTGQGRGARLRATVYSSTLPTALTHEMVHAYCCQTFGEAGPDWYKEGMADVFAYLDPEQSGVRCPLRVLTALRTGAPLLIDQIVRSSEFTRPLSKSLNQKLAARQDSDGSVQLTAWNELDAKTLLQMRESYAWGWLMCHMLMQNPNYNDRFRRLGDLYLAGHHNAFDRLFGEFREEIQFEFSQLASHVASGYRVDLCHWDWSEPARRLQLGDFVSRRIEASRGYQATGLFVERGKEYAYETAGSWATSAQGPATDAGGTLDGTGRLMGVIASDGALSKPIELSAAGTLSATASGPLYVRCCDAWHQIADNEGDIHVRFSQ